MSEWGAFSQGSHFGCDAGALILQGYLYSEPADGIGAFAGPAFDPDDIEGHLAAWTIHR